MRVSSGSTRPECVILLPNATHEDSDTTGHFVLTYTHTTEHESDRVLRIFSSFVRRCKTRSREWKGSTEVARMNVLGAGRPRCRRGGSGTGSSGWGPPCQRCGVRSGASTRHQPWIGSAAGLKSGVGRSRDGQAKKWSGIPGSNRRHPAWEAGALPTELIPLEWP